MEIMGKKESKTRAIVMEAGRTLDDYDYEGWTDHRTHL
jgi:hypothetical protein